jgi:MFS family permease
MNDSSQPITPHPAPVISTRPAWIDSLLRPILAFRLNYMPVVMIYFTYGALGLIDVSRDLWIKEALTLNPAQLAAIAVWLSLPWTIKMVFGELVDSTPIFGSQRAAYVLIGASLMAGGMVMLAGAAGGWLTFLTPNNFYLAGTMLIVIGMVVQDVVADAMSTEVVARVDDAGNPRADHDVRADLGMVQVLGRIAVSLGVLAVAGLSGWLAHIFSREAVFFIALVIPAISITGVFLRGNNTVVERRAPDWRILGGGIAYGALVIALGVGGMPYAQEIIFCLSMAVVCFMLVLVTKDISHENRRAIFFTTVIIFLFRATPSVGDAYFWWTLDVLKFDAAFYGILRQTGAVIAIAAMWMFSKQLTEYSITSVLFWIAVAGTALSLPNVGLIYGLHEWTEGNLGFGARTIAIVDAATASPFVQLSMIPLLTLVAYYAPAGHRATWFALMASMMNLALVAGQLQTKYLNEIFVVDRGHYEALGPLLITVVVIGFVLPIGAIALFGRRIARD